MFLYTAKEQIVVGWSGFGSRTHGKERTLKILYVAQLATGHDRDQIWSDAFQRMGSTVVEFATYDYEYKGTGILKRFLTRLHLLSTFRQMRSDLISLVLSEEPDWIHFRLPLHFDNATLMMLKESGAVISSYYNDDPFSGRAVWGLHSMFIKCIPLYDAHFVFRKKNITEFCNEGAKRVVHCPPSYDPDYHFSNSRKQSVRYENDAVFIGHWEDDGRSEYIIRLIAEGFKTTVRGPLWDRAAKGTIIEAGAPFAPVFGEEYSRLYRTARAGICFFSTMNSDTWTRRPLEIIGSGGLLVCQRTEEAESYFADKEEAFFFSSEDELVDVLNIIINDVEYAENVKRRGYETLLSGRFSISDRIEAMIRIIHEVSGK